MTDNKIPELEKKIYTKLDFTSELLIIDNKYNDDNIEHPYFKVNEVKLLFKSLEYPYEYAENSHGLILKNYDDFSFKAAFFIKNNVVLPYFVVLRNGEYFGPKVTNLYSLLNYLPYDENLLNPNFRINTLDDLKDYVLDIIDLCNRFTDEYIKAIEAGNVTDVA